MIERLQEIYNRLLNVKVKEEEALIMSGCLQTLKNLIEELEE